MESEKVIKVASYSITLIMTYCQARKLVKNIGGAHPSLPLLPLPSSPSPPPLALYAPFPAELDEAPIERVSGGITPGKKYEISDARR